MFSSPAVRLQSQENSEGVIARKPGLLNSISRKAFQDRDVNRKLTDGNQMQPLKAKLSDIKAPELKKAEPKHPDWLFDTCTYKSFPDTYEDILPKSERLIRNCRKPMKAFTKQLYESPQLKTIAMEPPCFVDIDPSILSLPSPSEDLVFDYLEVEDEIKMPKFPNFDM